MSHTDDMILSSFQIFSLSSLTWRAGPALPFTTNWGQAVVSEGRLYHVGGLHSADRVLRLEVLLHPTPDVSIATAGGGVEGCDPHRL